MEQSTLHRSPITTKENCIMNDAEKNAETVRRGYAAFNSADMKTLTEIFHESASWHTPGRGTLAGDHKGREATCLLRPMVEEREGPGHTARAQE
jgi:ketosteroid isomerase-like protein